MRLASLAALVALLLSCRSDDSFACGEDSQCESAGIMGTCEPNGYCSFFDETCPSGRRYGDLAGGGLAGVCVQGSDSESGSATTNDSASGSATSASSSGPGGSSTAAPPACAAGVCIGDPLPGWSGPVVLAEDEGDGCEAVFQAGSGLAPRGECDCTCEGGGAGCGYELFFGPDCTLSAQQGVLRGECVSVPLGIQSIAITGESVGSACEGSPPLEAALEDRFSACEPAIMGSCDDGSSCVGADAGMSVCHWRDGEHECPSPDDQRTVLHRSATGGYDCGCACGSAAACDSIEIFGGSDCSGPSMPVQGSDCLVIPEGLGNVSAVTDATCEDLGSRNTPEPLPLDEAPTEVDPVTLCCR